MTEILWGPYQEQHITERHGITVGEFEAAWFNRIDLRVRSDDSYESTGNTEDGLELHMIWRWDRYDPTCVFPITAYPTEAH